MGLQAQRDGDLANAESMLRRAIQIAPGYVGANLGLASLLDQRGQSDAARTHWEAALSTEPENTTALVQLGTYWASRGDLARAERLLRAALDFDPHGSEAMFDLGKLSEMMGRRAEALAWYRRFVAEPGADPAAARTALERIRLLEGGAR
jgi:Flp pilus assembly protein TadD